MDTVLIDIINDRIDDLQKDVARLGFEYGNDSLMDEMQICINVYQSLLKEYYTKINKMNALEEIE